MAMAHDGIQQVVLVLELIGEVVGSLASFVVQLIRLIRICIGIWSILTGRQPAFVGNGHQEDIPQYSVKFPSMAVADRIQQVVLVLQLIAEVVGSLAGFVVQLIRLIRICIRIWTIWIARQPASVGNGYQDDIPLAGNDEAEAEADATNRQLLSDLKVSCLSLQTLL
nr:hypothetical protein CFP56_75387 [Quercus suber]